MIFWIIILLLFALLYNFYRNELEIRVMVEKPFKGKGLKIGIVSDWNRKGVPYQSKFLSKCLSKDHEVHIFAYNEYVKEEDDAGYKKLVFSRKIQPSKVIRWLKTEGIKVVFFPDRLEDIRVLEWCKENKVATVMVINHETIKKQEFAQYRMNTILMCPVKCTYDLLKKNGFKNLRFIRWGIDNKKYLPVSAEIKHPLRFIHNAGLGGAQWRKNTLAVVEAFDDASRSHPDIRLVLKTQKPLKEYPDAVQYLVKKNRQVIINEKDLSMNQLIKLYRSCHVSVLPSKWEGIGIPFLESLAMGLPVLTVDAPPMNEWVRDGYNGLCAPVQSWEERKDPELLVKGALVDVRSLEKCINKLSSVAIIKKMGMNAAKSMKGSASKFTKEVSALIKEFK